MSFPGGTYCAGTSFVRLNRLCGKIIIPYSVKNPVKDNTGMSSVTDIQKKDSFSDKKDL
jgi:hypothetical protein